MVRMSRTAGIPRRITGSLVSSAAARAGSAEFLDPLTGIAPVSGRPPLMTNLSMFVPSHYRPRTEGEEGVRKSPGRRNRLHHPVSQTLTQQARWGRRFRLPGHQEIQFFTALRKF